jgi:hypothetical protein
MIGASTARRTMSIRPEKQTVGQQAYDFQRRMEEIHPMIPIAVH